MIVVTGGAGFIGSNIVRALISRGERDVVVVDDMSDGRKFANIVELDIADYWDKDAFRARLAAPEALSGVRAVVHQGACSDTTEWDGRFMLDVNFEYSKAVLEACQRAGVPFVYASSGAVYGVSTRFEERAENERPVNVYGFSKLLFDRFVRRYALRDGAAQVAGLRYFNVYGPGEAHKGRMSSVVLQFHDQLVEHGEVRLFEGTDGYADGDQRRDFLHVDDAVAVNLWLLEHPEVSGIFNVGTGVSRSFNDVARAVISWHGGGRIRYVPFPEDLAGRYQSFTEADVTALRASGFGAPFRDVEDGVPQYLEALRIDRSRLVNR